MAQAGSAFVKILADDSQARKTINGFFGFLKKTGSIAAGVMGGLAVFETVKNTFEGLSQSTIGANADMETYYNTLKVVLKSGEEAQKTLDWAGKFAVTTPFEIPEIVEATTRLASYGMTAKDTLGDIGDMASVMGKPLMDAVEAVADAQTGELERLKEFGITKQQIIDQAAEMGMNEVVNAKGQITDMKNFNKALFALMEDRYSGGMKLQAKTFKGMVSNAKDAMGTIAREMSKPVFEKLKAGLQSILPVGDALVSFVRGDLAGSSKILTDAFGPKMGNQIFNALEIVKKGANMAKDAFFDMQPALMNLWGIFKDIAPMVGVVLAGAFKTLTTVIPPVVNGLTKVVKAITGWEGFIPVVTGLVSAFVTYRSIMAAIAIQQGIVNGVTKTSIALSKAQRAAHLAMVISGGGAKGALLAMRAAMSALNITMLANPIVLVVAAVVGLIAIVVVAYKRSEKFRSIVDGLWASLKKFGSYIATEFMADIGELKELFGKISARWKSDTEDMKNAFGAFKDKFNSDSEDVKNGFTKVKDKFNKDSGEIKTLFTKTLPDAWNDLLESFKSEEGKESPFKAKLKGWKTDFVLWLDDMKITIQKKLLEWGTAFNNWLMDQNEENKRQFGVWGTSISNWFTGMKETISNKLGSWWTTIYTWFSELPSKTATRLSNWGTSISNWFSKSYTTWKTGLGKWWTTISTWFTELPGKATEKLANWGTSISNWFSKTYTNWKTGLGKWWTAIFEWFTTLPSRSWTQLENWWKSIKGWMKTAGTRWKAAFSDWWVEIKSWFSGLGKKVEIKKSGEEIVKSVKDGATGKKKELSERIGKIVVDGIGYMLAIAGIVALSAGREIIKRMINGMQASKAAVSKKWDEFKSQADTKMRELGSNLYSWGKNLPGRLGAGIREKASNATTSMSNMAKSLKDKLDARINDIKNAAAGIPGKIGSAITSKVKSATNSMEDLASSLVKKFKSALGINSPSTVFFDMAGWIIKGLVNGLSAGNLKDLGTKAFKDFAGGAFDTLSSIKSWVSGGFDLGGAGGNVTSWMKQAMALTKTPMSWLQPLTTMAMKESGGRTGPSTINKWDSNWKAGIPSMGLMQTIMPTFNAYKMKGLNDIMNPVHNAVAAIRYIKSRYGSVFNTPGIKSMMQGGPYKGYAKGGFFLNGPQMGLFGEGGPEMALPLIGKNMMPYAQAVASNLAKLTGGGFGGEEVHNHYWNVNADEINEVQKLVNMVNGLRQGVRKM